MRCRHGAEVLAPLTYFAYPSIPENACSVSASPNSRQGNQPQSKRAKRSKRAMPRGAQPGERRGGRAKGTPNKTPLQKAEALAAKVAKAEARGAVKVAVEPLGHMLAKDVLDWGMQDCVARAVFRRPRLADEPPNPNEDEGEFLKWFALAAELAKTLAPYQSPRLLAHAIKAPATESCAGPRTNARERVKELLLAAIAADEAENAAKNASNAEPAAEPENTQRAADLSAPDDADGVLCTSENLT